MKNSKIFAGIIVYIVCITTSFLVSCSDQYLQEVPKGFLSPENTFTTKEGFESGVNDLYRLARTFATADVIPGMSTATNADKSLTGLYASGTDIAWFYDNSDIFGNYAIVNSFNPTALNFWVKSFTLIKGANVILTRSNSDFAKWDSDQDKLLIQAEAKFFRALGYRYLVYLYGEVPIIDEEITSPKLDFVRDPKEDVLNFMVTDLEFATQYLPITNNRDGYITKAAADQLLAETYISIENYDKSIEASSRIISDPQYHLMTARFGTMTDKPGDVFWDLFRLGNQNNSANKEVILAWQVEYNVPGGFGENKNQRSWGPFLENLKDPDGKAAILKDAFLGRPAAFIRPSVYLEYTIWAGNRNNDIRNSKYNMQRIFYINNPASAYFGKAIIPKPADTVRNCFVYIQKCNHPYGAPQGYDASGHIYTDIYAMRLAETYLLRAEAYLDKGDKIKAAADINVVRSRAKASLVLPADVNIDYILDERARELVVEEPRRVTLGRLGLLYDRVKRYNPVSAPSIMKFNNLWPIPQTEIDANVGANLGQNPGY